MDSCSLYYGCDKDNDLIVLSEDTRQWTPYFSTDEVIFQNELSESAIKVLEYVDSVQSYDRGDECAPGIEEMTLTKLISTSFIDTISVRLTRQKVDIENVNFQLTYLEDSKTVYPTKDSNRKYQDKVTINQKVFKEVLISKCSSCSSLSELVFSKDNGLVAYRLNNVYWTKK